jgi:hypothetical protein
MSTAPPFQRDPKFGWDPWLGPLPPPSPATSEELLAALQVYAGADTLSGDINLLPPGLSMYGSYVDGFGGYGELVARFGHTAAMLISITIAANRAHCGDFEPGAMQTGQFPGWYDHIANHEYGLPWGYASAGTMQQLIDAAQGRPFIRWSAHYGFGPHVCGPRTCGYPQAHWTQWDFHGAQGQNIDRSVGTWLYSPPKPKPPEDTVSIAAAQNHDGRIEVFVEKNDGSVVHTWQVATGGWAGSKPGKPAEWYPLGNVNQVALAEEAPAAPPVTLYDQENPPQEEPPAPIDPSVA